MLIEQIGGSILSVIAGTTIACGALWLARDLLSEVKRDIAVVRAMHVRLLKRSGGRGDGGV